MLHFASADRCPVLPHCRLTQAAITHLISKLRNLQRLELYWNLNVRDEVLLSLAAYAPSLAFLSLSGCKNVTDDGLRTLSGACTGLTHLDLTR